ncbi:MAG: Rnf-Nqr domain containing protein [Pseudomonadota bacterium]
MNELFLILLGTVLANHLAQDRFRHLRPFVAASTGLQAALSVAVMTVLVLTLSSSAAYLLHARLLVPLQAEYLQTFGFILVIAAIAQVTDILIRRIHPALDDVVGNDTALIAINCAVLGIALLNAQASESFVEAVVYGFGVAAGFALLLVLFAAIRERLSAADVPIPFRGAAIAVMTAGIMCLALMGFSGMVRP